ncbi:hypothetical protein [Pseudomonas phage vB_PA6_GUMS]|uniref:Uncharacterized protein n=1 Tax=Pseudomonas phage vB_PA6_GUMS TaxID=2656518 RepID=A0A8T8BER9_9CAUD|nr:hypothetical protein [Pseudomonas phage vB_PA6_GUMS]
MNPFGKVLLAVNWAIEPNAEMLIIAYSSLHSWKVAAVESAANR